MTGVFEHHDRTRFETIGISLAVDDQSVTRKRALGAFERVLDVRAKSDRDIAQAIRDLEIDIWSISTPTRVEAGRASCRCLVLRVVV